MLFFVMVPFPFEGGSRSRVRPAPLAHILEGVGFPRRPGGSQKLDSLIFFGVVL